MSTVTLTIDAPSLRGTIHLAQHVCYSHECTLFLKLLQQINLFFNHRHKNVYCALFLGATFLYVYRVFVVRFSER